MLPVCRISLFRWWGLLYCNVRVRVCFLLVLSLSLLLLLLLLSCLVLLCFVYNICLFLFIYLFICLLFLFTLYASQYPLYRSSTSFHVDSPKQCVRLSKLFLSIDVLSFHDMLNSKIISYTISKSGYAIFFRFDSTYVCKILRFLSSVSHTKRYSFARSIDLFCLDLIHVSIEIL